MEIRFGEEIIYADKKYMGLSYLGKHIEHFPTTLKEYPRHEWVHQFIHTLEMVPRGRYTSKELRQGTSEWEILTINFTQTFEFTSEHPTINVVLQVIKENIFE